MLHKFQSKHHKLTPAALTARQKRIFDFLQNNPIGVLSTITPDGEPHGVVIYFVIEADFSLSFLTKADTRKYDNLTHNNHLVLTVCEARKQATVQVIGAAYEIYDSLALNSIAGKVLATSMHTSDQGLPAISKLDAGPYVAFKIIPSQIRMAVYAQPDGGDYNDLFEVLEQFEFPPL